MTLRLLLAETAARVPDRPAIAFEGARITYAELDGQATAASPPASVLPLPMPNVPDSIARFHGALRGGAVVVPINPLLRERETALRRRPFDPEPGTEVALYTSGTTGEPKRIELQGDALRANAEYLVREAFALSEEDVVFGAAPLSHVFGMTGCMNASIVAGAMLALVRRFDPVDALELIEKERVTVFMGVPTMLIALLAASTETGRAPQLRLAHVGGAPCPAELRLAFEERFATTVLEAFGMTEAGGAVTVEHLGRPRKPGSVGTAAAGQELRIGDDGEVHVGRGGRWFATGDLGRLDDEGYLYLLDRKKDVILRGGYTVYPRQVEEALVEHPAVREAVVVGIPHARLGEEVVALVIVDEPCEADTLKAFARERVAAYAYPRLVVVVDDLPRTPTGKVLRRAIDRATLAEQLTADQTVSRPT